MSNREEVDQLAHDIRIIGDEARNKFGQLTPEKLNWKPAPDSWSVAQCFDHLITTNNTYFPILDSILAGKKSTKLVERLPLLPKLWGSVFVKSLDPKTPRKLKAPSRFQPSASNIADSIVEDFFKHQVRVADTMEAAKDLKVDQIIITSPAASFITYSLLDAFRILVVHERRHFQQAVRVTENNNFPN